MMLTKMFKSGLTVGFALLITGMRTSCEKEKETSRLIIVKNSSGQVVAEELVTLFPEPTVSSQGSLPIPSLANTESTDANGRAEFTYDLEVILNVYVVKYEGNDTLKEPTSFDC